MGRHLLVLFKWKSVYSHYQNHPFNLKCIIILSYIFYYIVISINNDSDAQYIKDSIINMGITEEKIIYSINFSLIRMITSHIQIRRPFYIHLPKSTLPIVEMHDIQVYNPTILRELNEEEFDYIVISINNDSDAQYIKDSIINIYSSEYRHLRLS